jgi:glycosyltransferase involved in cell wall biosynthesis
MRVVHYYPRALVGDGGITNAVRKLSQGMVNAGAEVVVAHDAGVAPPERTPVKWVPVRHQGRTGIRVPVGLEVALRGADVAVLHSAWTLHNVVAAAVARRLGVAYVPMPRGAYDPGIVSRRRVVKKLWWRALERKLLRESLGVHVFFEEERANLERLGYHGPVIVAPNGVEPPDAVTWDGGSGGYVLWMGRFDPDHKGLDLLLEAIALIEPRQRPHLRLHGPDWRGRKSDVVALCSELALEPWVTIGKPIHGETKWRTLAAAAGFVYPSRWEGFGNSVAEATSIGVPTLTTPYPLGRWLASRGGAIVADATPSGLAAGLGKLLDDDAPEVGRRGAKVTREELSWDAVAKSWLEQAQELLARDELSAAGRSE